MQKGKIGVTTENIFPIIKKFLYSDHEIFLRELVSNAMDASQKMKKLASLGEFEGELGDLKVKISLDTKKKTLTISDRGLGMTEEEIDKYINQIAFSSAEEFINKFKDQTGIIGKFGLGFYSSFMVSEKVEIITKSFKEDAKAIKWSCDGSPEYSIEEIEKDDRGTDIILYIDDEVNQQHLHLMPTASPTLEDCGLISLTFHLVLKQAKALSYHIQAMLNVTLTYLLFYHQYLPILPLQPIYFL